MVVLFVKKAAIGLVWHLYCIISDNLKTFGQSFWVTLLTFQLITPNPCSTLKIV